MSLIDRYVSVHHRYVIYYEQEDCGSEAVSAIGFVSDDDDELIGYTGGENALCATESLCLVDPNSEQCQALEFVKKGETTFSIGEDGLIFQCDSTNTDGECSFLDQCYGSSVYPNCHFIVATTSDIVKNPDLIRNTKTEGNTALDEHAYLVYYADSECSELEGIHGIVNGETEVAVTDESISCRDAMACAFHPLGAACNSTMGDGGVTAKIMRMLTGPHVNGEATTCKLEGDCVPVPNSKCIQSTIHPSCYYRMPTAVALLSNPDEYLTYYSVDGETESKNEKDGKTDTNGDAGKTNPDDGEKSEKDEDEGNTSGASSLVSRVLIGVVATAALLL